MKYDFIAIEGNIGAGKTTFASQISELTGARLLLERFEENPFLKEFYEEQDKFAFETEKFFFADRIEQLRWHFDQRSSSKTISDFTVFKSFVFANITLKNEQRKEFNSFFSNKIPDIKSPDLILYLKNDPIEMKGRILKRGREYEKNINDNYLVEIEKAYESFWQSNPELNVLQIHPNQLKFPYKKEDLQKLLKYLEYTEIKGFKHLDMDSLGH